MSGSYPQMKRIYIFCCVLIQTKQQQTTKVGVTISDADLASTSVHSTTHFSILVPLTTAFGG